MEPKLLSFEEYCVALTKNPTPNSLHGLIVEYSDGRLEPFTQQFGPLYNNKYGKLFRVWDVNSIYQSIKTASERSPWSPKEKDLYSIIRETARNIAKSNAQIGSFRFEDELYIIRQIYDDKSAHVRVYQFEHGFHIDVFYATYNNSSPLVLTDSITLGVCKKMKEVVKDA